MPPLPRAFFARPSPQVARELIGCVLVRELEGIEFRVQLQETEAYLGAGDPASHAFRGLTARNRVMFGPPGIAYVYFIYGMHHCLNVVTGADGDPQAVLLRGGAWERVNPGQRVDGPGRLAKALSVGLECNGWDLCLPGASLWLAEGQPPVGGEIKVTPRVGVRDDSPLRYHFRSSGPQGSRRANEKRAR